MDVFSFARLVFIRRLVLPRSIHTLCVCAETKRIMIWDRMKNLPLKLTLAVLTFFIGITIVGLWYFSLSESISDETLSDMVLSTKFVVENPCDYPQPPNRELEPEEAVYLTECFIIQNGYTNLPPIADKSKLTPENLYPGTDEEGLKMRHDSLERKAYSYERSQLYGGSWVVIFRYKQHPEVVKFYGDRLNSIGRAVTMDFYGQRIRVHHSDYPLRMPDSKIINP